MNLPARRRSLLALVVLFAALSMLMISGACIASRRATEDVKAQRYRELHAIATLKVGQIVAWREERLADAQAGAAHLGNRAAFALWLAHPKDAAMRESILQDLGMLRDAYGYWTLAVLSMDGRVILSLDPRPIDADAEVKAFATRALEAGGAVAGDISRGSAGGKLHLDIIAPIQGPKRTLAMLLLRVDPEARLFPLIQSWPNPSDTAETTLVRREGDQVRYLTRLRHAEDAPLTLSLPVARQDLPAAQAAMGRTGAFLGRDYRGVEVLADLHPLPGTPWYMVAEMDTREVLAEARYRTGVIQGFAALGILLGALLLGFLFYLGEAKLYHGLFQATRFAGQSGPKPDATTVRRMRQWARGLGFAGISIGSLVVLGWILDVSLLKGTLPDFGITKANTAVGTMLAGIALTCLASPRTFLAVARTCAVLLLLLGGLTLMEYLAGIDLHLDQALFRAPAGMLGALAPGRMAPITALDFLLSGSALLLASYRRTIAWSQWIALPIGFLAVAALWGHLLGPFGHHGLGRYLQMTFPAVLAFLTVAMGLLYLEPEEGLMRRLSARSMGGWMLRHLVPVLLALPLLVSWLGAVIQNRGWLETSATGALETLAFMAFLLVAAWWVARSLDRLDSIRDQAEADLRESRERLGLVLDTIPQAVFWKDSQGRFLGCNKAFAEQLGQGDPASIVGKTDLDLSVPPEEAEAYRADDRQVMESNRPKLHIVEPLQKADGTRMWVETSKVPMLDADGRPAGVLGIYEDITERMRMEEALQASEVWHRAIVETAMDGYMVVDREARILQASGACARITGYSVEELVRLRVPDLEAEEHPEGTTAHIGRVFAQGHHRFETRQRRKDGRVIDVEVSVQVAPGAEGKLVAFVRDVTERKQAEAAIQKSEAQYRQFTDLLPLGVVAHQQGRIMFVNPAAAAIFGAGKPEELIGLPVLERIHPDDRARVRERIHAGQEESRPVPLIQEQMLRVDGSSFTAEVVAHPIILNGLPAVMAVFSDITERKLVEDQLRSSRARLAEAQVLAHLGNWDLDLATGTLQLSDESCRIFGLDPSRDDLTREILLRLVHPEDREMVDRRFQEAIAERSPYRMTHRLKLADGTIKFVDVRGQATHDADGAPCHATGTVLDITDLKKAEESRQESEDRLKSLSDHLPGGMVYQMDTGEDGSIRHMTYVSAGAQQLHGIPADRLMQDAALLYDQILAEDAAILAGKEASAIAAVVPFSGEYRVCHPSGEIRWYLATSSPRKLANNHLVWDGIELDITERKRAEQALEQTYREQQLIFQNMINAFVIFESVFDASGSYVSFRFGQFNGAFGRIAKLELDTVRGRDVFEVWPETEQSWVEIYGEVATTGIPRTFDMYHAPTRGWYHCNAYRPTKAPDRVCVIFEDVTEKKAADTELHRLLDVADRSRRALLSLLEDQRNAESEIRRLNADLEQRVQARTLELAAANKELEAFAYSVSHDLRAPLRHMDGFLGLLARHLGDRLDDKGSHYLQVAQGAAVRMGQLVDGLLSFSRLGRAELHMVEVDATQLVTAVIDELKDDPGHRKIDWHVDRLPVLNGDPTLLRLVFQNLIGNALKFTRHQPAPRVEIQPIDGLEGESGILIRDNGVGFDSAYAHKLFGVFQRLHREDEFEGTGIGLANVHRIVTRHNGRVWAESRPGEGATFYLAFPVKGSSR